MRITNKCELTLGIINILLAVTGTIILLARHDTERIGLLSIPLATGISGILCGIETDKQRQKRKAELIEKAKLYGWCEEDDEE